MKKIVLLKTILVLLLISPPLLAQQRTLSGKVTSADDGTTIPGVNVILKGTTIGTVTDGDGNYTISISSEGGTLAFSFIGFLSQDVEIGSRARIDVQLKQDVTELSEVIVTGYTSLKRSDLTSSISQVMGEKMQYQALGSIDNMLQGAAPGVIVTNQNGRPGGNAYIRIRGTGSVNGSNEPLFIIDGVQMTQADYNTINPNDIESTTILKDAASTSIYGARASNGVVLVSTKKGSKSKKPQLQYRYQVGRKEINPYNFDVMNKEQKILYETELGLLSQQEADDLRASLANPETNWQEVLLRKGKVETHDLSLSNSSDNTKYFFSLGSYDEQGLAKGSDFNRLTMRLNTEFKVTNWMTLGNQLSFAHTNEGVLRDRYNVQNPFNAMFTYNPYEPEFIHDDQGNIVVDADGNPEYNLTQNGFSISEAIKNVPERKKTTNAIGNFFATVNPLKGLSATSRVGVNYRIYNRETYQKPGSVLDGYIGDPDAPGSKTDNGNYRLLVDWTNTAQYEWSINNQHNIKISVGTEYISNDIYGFFVTSKGFANELLTTQDNAAAVSSGGTSRQQTALWSQFSQLFYNFKDKYIFSASFRRDGSSKFGKDNQFGNFYSASAGWNVKEENFLANITWLDQLKLRGSAGTSGNLPGNATSVVSTASDLPYASKGLYSFSKYSGQVASYPAQLENKDLKWESNFNYTVGIDFGLFRNRLTGSFDYYYRKTFDLLFDLPLSQTTGFSSRLQNIGEMQNKGIEIELRGDILRKDDWKLTLSGSIATANNKVLKLENGGQDVINSNSALSLLREGLAANTFYLVRYAGVNPTNGEPLYYTKDNKITNVYSSGDAVAVEGKFTQPVFFGNFGFNLRYKSLALTSTFYYQGGNYTLNLQNERDLLSDGFNATKNQRVDAFNYWKKPGDTNVLPKPSLTANSNNSDRYLQRGDFIRLRNVMISYNLPTKWITKLRMESLQIYLQGTNLWTYNPFFKGDPEVGRGSEETDLDLVGEATLYSFPNTRGYTFGLNITF
jgi:TonB-linked SusC/RagA family outer membrane protein